MKKFYTLLGITAFLFLPGVSLAQYSFPAIVGPETVQDGSPVTLNINDLINSAGVPTLGTYSSFSVSVDWTEANASFAYSNEAALTMLTNGSTNIIDPPTSGASGTTNPATILFDGVFTTPYDPSVDGTMDLLLDVSYGETNWSNIIVTIFETPTCPAASDIIIANITTSSVELSWTPGGTETQWNIEYGAPGFVPGTGAELGAVIGTTNNPESITGLTAGTSYDIYVQADCGVDGTSGWSAVASALTYGDCSSSGSYTYLNNSTLVSSLNGFIANTPGDYITLTFTAGDTESCCDDWFITDAANGAGNVIATGAGSIVGSYESTTGEISFYVVSDGSVTGAQFDYSLSCAPPPSCPDPIVILDTIADTTMTVTWNPNGGELNWIVEYGTPGFSPGTGAFIDSVVVTDTFIVINGLTSNTEYDIYVMADCDASGMSQWSNVLNTTTLPSCGDNISGLCYSLTSTQEVLLSFSAPAGQWAELVFNAGGVETCCDEVVVYDGLNGTGNIIYGQLVGGGLSDYSTEGPVLSTTGQLSLVVNSDGSFTCNSQGYTPFDVTVNCYDPFCLPPSGEVVDSLATDAAQVSWVAQGIATDWEVQWGEPGFVPGMNAGIDSMVVSDTTVLIDGLVGNTTYEYYIQSDCGVDGVSDWYGPFSFTTLCDAVYSVPFVETFEDNSDSRNCWTNEYVSGTANWTFDTGSSSGAITDAFEGDKNAVFVSEFGTNDPISKLVSPTFDFTGLDSVALSFAYGQESWFGDQNVLKLYIMGPSEQWTLVNEYLLEVPEWTLDTVYISDTVQKIAFEGINNYGHANIIDYVRVEACTLNPGTDGEEDFCRLDEIVDLDQVIIPGEPNGDWSFPSNPGILNGSTANVSSISADSYDFYYVVGNICGVKDTTIATINVFPPTSAGNDGTITVCRNEPINLFDGLSGNVDLGGTWYDPSDSPLSGAITTTSNIPGSFNFLYITSNGVCEADTSLVEVVVGTCDFLSLGEEQFAELTVYPNPTSDVLNIEAGPNAGAMKIEISDMNGRTVLANANALADSTSSSLSIAHLENGVYTLRIFNTEGQRTFKIVKQ